MATIISLADHRRQRPPKTGAVAEAARILLFTGVRYETGHRPRSARKVGKTPEKGKQA